jgi:hypothetical protein
MAFYWAEFCQKNGQNFRFDTRIYLQDVDELEGGTPCDSDKCVGAVVGKNPGSAKPDPNYLKVTKLKPIDLNGDKFLPTVRNRIFDAYKQKSKQPPPRSYVQVLNLFYLCNPTLQTGIQTLQGLPIPYPKCPKENQSYEWIWYAWGGFHNTLNQLKGQFLGTTQRPIYVEGKTLTAISKVPHPTVDFARHPQGVRSKKIISALVLVV